METIASQEKLDCQNARATETVSTDEQNTLLAILNFWHKLEFFIPFDLDQCIEEADEGRIRWLHSRDLTGPLSNLWEANLPDEYELKSFYLYLGIFDKSEITRICERAIGSNRS